MANRHSHKKLRAEIRARMASTGESHQAAHRRILALRSSARRGEHTGVPELIATTYFGVPITVAAYEVLSHVRLILVSGSGGPMGLPWGSPSPIRVHTDGVQ
jgi:hypothetical protein